MSFDPSISVTCQCTLFTQYTEHSIHHNLCRNSGTTLSHLSSTRGRLASVLSTCVTCCIQVHSTYREPLPVSRLPDTIRSICARQSYFCSRVVNVEETFHWYRHLNAQEPCVYTNDSRPHRPKKTSPWHTSLRSTLHVPNRPDAASPHTLGSQYSGVLL